MSLTVWLIGAAIAFFIMEGFAIKDKRIFKKEFSIPIRIVIALLWPAVAGAIIVISILDALDISKIR